jgi:hypothetical protein
MSTHIDALVPNRLVNADARGGAAIWTHRRARAGYQER